MFANQRERAFALALIVAAALVSWGVYGWSPQAGRIVAGILVAVIAWLVLSGETTTPPPPAADEALDVEEPDS